jgi:hypothetical protein
MLGVSCLEYMDMTVEGQEEANVRLEQDLPRMEGLMTIMMDAPPEGYDADAYGEWLPILQDVIPLTRRHSIALIKRIKTILSS